MNKVQVWEEKVIIPTYEAGKPDKNPMFLEKRVYQGSSGRIYPHTVIEKISDEKVDKEYTALFLENDYLKVMMLPELGGRIQSREYQKKIGEDEYEKRTAYEVSVSKLEYRSDDEEI